MSVNNSTISLALTGFPDLVFFGAKRGKERKGKERKGREKEE
jgi:hypothetical protein